MGKKSKKKKGKGAGPKAPARTIQDRIHEYLLADVVEVDISNCVPGSNARAVKPGGVAQLNVSIRERGYMKVRYRASPTSTFCRAASFSSACFCLSASFASSPLLSASSWFHSQPSTHPP